MITNDDHRVGFFSYVVSHDYVKYEQPLRDFILLKTGGALSRWGCALNLSLEFPPRCFIYWAKKNMRKSVRALPFSTNIRHSRSSCCCSIAID